MSRTIQGIIKNGAVELSEPINSADGTRVIVSIVEPSKEFTSTENVPITFGMFPQLRDIAENDLDEIKHIWEREWEASWNRLGKST